MGTSVLCCFRCVQAFTPPECQGIQTQGVRQWEYHLEFANISALLHPILSKGLKANSVSYWKVLFGRLVEIWILRQDKYVGLVFIFLYKATRELKLLLRTPNPKFSVATIPSIILPLNVTTSSLGSKSYPILYPLIYMRFKLSNFM